MAQLDFLTQTMVFINRMATTVTVRTLQGAMNVDLGFWRGAALNQLICKISQPHEIRESHFLLIQFTGSGYS
ncbi:hypothetical protein CKO27_20710 [Thiocystis violacea]|nr:hypothetical protein [Thiocystis violacea]